MSLADIAVLSDIGRCTDSSYIGNVICVRWKEMACRQSREDENRSSQLEGAYQGQGFNHLRPDHPNHQDPQWTLQ